MIGADLIRDICESLAAHRLRATLALIGIVSGVATVVAALAMAEGSRRAAIADLGALGTDSVIVRARDRSGARGERLTPLLMAGDAEVLRRRFPGSTTSAMRLTSGVARAGAWSASASLAGVTQSWFESTRLAIARGRGFRRGDAHQLEVVLGDTIAKALFRESEPVGQRVLAGDEWRTVIGVLAAGAASARSSLPLVSADDTVFVPFETLDVSLGVGDRGDTATAIVLRLARDDDPVLAGREAARVLEDRRDGDVAAIDVVVPEELLRARLQAQRGSQVLLLSIGVLALLISGVGIINIMVASVAERAAEIGVRRAVGARRGAVRALFAGEALLLGAAGGVVGVPVGAMAAATSAHFGGWPVAVSMTHVSGALALALGTTLGASLYPAHLAASLSPIDALRQSM